MAERSAVYYCILCSLLGTVQVSSSRGLALAITRGLAGHTAMLTSPDICWLTYMLILSLILSIAVHQKYMNRMLEHHDASVVVPIHFLLWSAVTITAGMSLFDETSFQPGVGIPLFTAGLALSFAAVYMINFSKREPKPADSLVPDPEKNPQDMAVSKQRGTISADLTFPPPPARLYLHRVVSLVLDDAAGLGPTEGRAETAGGALTGQV